MPTKTYKCTNKDCNYIVEEFLNVNEEIKICKECGAKVNRVYNSVNVNLCFEGSYNSTRK